MGAVLLVRHGQASFGAADYDVLSETGRRQATVLGEEFARWGVRPVRVLSGALARQRDTARCLLAAAGPGEAQPEVDPRWDEYDHRALLAHHLAESRARLAVAALREGRGRMVQRALDGALAAWVAAGDCPRCERPWPRFRAETAAALDEALDTAGSGGTVVVLTSGGVIATVVAALLGLGADGLVALNRVVVNTGVTRVVRGRGGTSLVSFNEHGHLTAAGRDLLTYR